MRVAVVHSYYSSRQPSGENVVVDGIQVGRLKGRAPELLGFTSDGTGLLAVQHPDAADESTYVGSLVRFDLKSSAAKPLITSGTDALYRDFKLVDVKGERHVSFIKHNEIYRCGGQEPQWLGLAGENGEIRSLVHGGSNETSTSTLPI